MINSLVGRSLAGAFVGSVFGLLTHLIFFGDSLPSEGIRLPWQGALIGALLVGAVSIVVGGRELPNWLRIVAIVLTGCIVGILVGAFVFAPIMSDHGIFFGEKMRTINQGNGIALGAILGATVGLIAGIRSVFV